jgi:4'-phosphopantetheinyl transferase EntD
MSLVPAYADNPGLALTRPLFDPDIAVTVTDPRSARHRVLPQEAAALARAVEGRRRSFAAGRVAAHRAMSDLGLPVRPVLMGPDRAPIWPVGVTGSLSHSQTCCIAALGHSGRIRALGVDVEEDAPLADDLLSSVCTRSEIAWLATQPRSGRLAKLIFSAKECAYKCQYAMTRRLFGFEMFEITPDPDTGQFEATFTRSVAEFTAGTRLYGRFCIADGLIITAMTLRG